jgi:thioredoxin-like negative regulator of GroEL
MELVKAFEIKSVPTFIIIKDSEIFSRATGSQTRDSLLEMLNV